MGTHAKPDRPPGHRPKEVGHLGKLGCTTLLGGAIVILLLLTARITNSQDVNGSIDSYSAEISTPEPTPKKTIRQATVLPTMTQAVEDIVTNTPTPTSTPTNTPEPQPTSTKSLTVSHIRESRLASPTPPKPAATPTPEPVQPTSLIDRESLRPTPSESYSRTLKVPILMYHYVSVPPPDADVYRRDLSVTPEKFREQLAYLVDSGYTAIDLYDLSLAVVDKQPLPEKPVILTFDDGYIDNYRNAFPILREFSMKATFFIATGFVDAGNPNYMDWQMIEELAVAGMSIEPHSRNHIDLRDRERGVLLYEILGSQETIAAHIDHVPRYFAYPSGRYDNATIEILKELDFWGAVTTNGGTWHKFDDRYELTRQRVRFDTSLALFADLVD